MNLSEYIYIIKCPIDNAIIYVGKTVAPLARSRQHFQYDPYPCSPISIHINTLLKKGLTPVFEIIETIDLVTTIMDRKATAKNREIYWINFYYRNEESRILNKCYIYKDYDKNTFAKIGTKEKKK